MAACTTNQSEPKVVSLNAQEAAEEAATIRKDAVVEMADGLELNLWASEKLLADPIGLDMTDDGEAYITVTNRSTSSEFDIRGHRDWMIASISWDEVKDRTNFLHNELAPEKSAENTWLDDFNADSSHDWKDLTVQQEEVYRITDRSGDGVADRSERYLSDFSKEETDVLGSVFVDKEDIYLAVAPDMWRTKDANEDGIADSKTSISSGYAIHVGFSGHGMSGITKGPDGRIYWSIGDVGLNVTGPDGKEWKYPNQGAILRSDPDGSNFEVFAAGVRNTHEFTFDKYGNLITVDNDGDHAGEHERLVYLVNGSDSGWRATWQYGKYVDDKNNGYNVWMDENYFQPRFENQAAHLLPPLSLYHSGPAGMAYNPGTALSEKWKDHFFISEFVGAPSGSAIHAFDLKPKGASFELKTDQPIMKGILATGIDFGPDGSLYFADWIQGWDTKNKGRIWKIDTPASASSNNSKIRKETEKLLGDNFESYEGNQLATLLHHADMRVRMKAHFELVDRSAKEVLLDAVSQDEHQLARLHGIWGVGQFARDNTEEAAPLVNYLNDSDPEIRAQVAKTLGDVRFQATAEKLIPLLKDQSLRVQFFAAEALGRIKHEPATQPIIDMLEANDDRDVYLRHGGAIALARIGDRDAIAGLADHPSEAVRIAAVVALRRLEAPVVVRFLSDDSEFVVTNAARAINDDEMLMEAVPDLARMLDQQKFNNTPLLRRAINANLYNGTAADAKRLASFAVRKNVSDSLRTEAIAALSVWPGSSTLDRVNGKYRGAVSNSRQDAENAITSIIDPVLSGQSMMSKVALAEAVRALEMRPALPQLFAVLDENAPPEVKIAVLNTLDKLQYEKMDEAVKMAMAADNQQLRMTALSLIPSLDTSDQQKADFLASALNNGAIAEQQSALKTLGSMRTEEANVVLQNQFSGLLDGDAPDEIKLELVQAADSSDSKELRSMLARYRNKKPADDLLATYQEALAGGNAERGERIFYGNEAAQCIRCHAVGGNGVNVGPDLANIGNTLDREQLLQSLIEPNSRIAPDFGSVLATLDDGTEVRGVLKQETDAFIVLQSADGESQKVQKTSIADRENSPSAMFSMVDILSKSELRDLVEFLTQRTNNQNKNEEESHGS
jgi:putative heme-binding domain-containing protein